MFRPGRALPVLRGPVFESNSSRTTFSALPVVHSNRSFSNYSTAQLTAQFRPLSPFFFSASRSVLPRITVRFPSNPRPFSSHYSTQFRPQLKPQFRLFSPSRPTLPRTTLRLSAPLSSAAQRILDDVEAHETGALYTEAPRIPATVHDIGDFSLMGLVDGWGPSDLMIQLLEFIKVSSGLPWWAAIGCLTLIWRVCFFPNALGLARNAATLPYINDKLEELKKTSAEARASGELLRMRQASTDMLDLYREWGYRPMIGVFTIFQIPIFITVFRTLTRCSYFPAPGWETGGMLWFKDLTVPDPYMILPLVSAITTGMSLMLNAKDQPTRPEGMVGLIICISPLLSLAFVPVIGMMQPAVLPFYTANLVCFPLLDSQQFHSALPSLPISYPGHPQSIRHSSKTRNPPQSAGNQGLLHGSHR